MRVFRTLLEQKIKERRQTFEEFAEFAEVFAREHGESGTLSACGTSSDSLLAEGLVVSPSALSGQLPLGCSNGSSG